MAQPSFPLPQLGADATAAAEPAGLRIARSWRRSVEQYRLDPGSRHRPRVLTAGALRERREPMEPWLGLARSGMEALFRQVREAGYLVILTDAQAVAVEVLFNPALDRELRQAGLYLGGCWSEEIEGTSAVALAALEQCAITVHHGEHFRALHDRLTCSAAPIHAPDGSLLAVLDASALRSPDDRRSQQLVLQMVQASARQIEDAWFMRQHARHLVLRLGRQRDFLEVACDGLVALDATGHIVAASPRLRSEGGAAPEPLVGQHFEQVFDARLDAVAAAAGQSATFALALRRRPADPPRFALARAPRVEHRAPRKPARTPAIPSRLAALAGQDPRMAQNVERALRVLDKGLDVLLLGESGTGKELFARAMHEASARAGAAFVALNCAAIPESLIEAELFGYCDGAFTGARARGARGKIVQAHGGTLFLDEIGDMPLALQTRLLRVLGEREVTPLGAERPTPVDLQVICATHRRLPELVASGQFRLDLYHRLSGFTIELPALRERSDRAQLIDAILHEEARALDLPEPRLAPGARAALLAHPWPGNLRQLRNSLRAALALADGDAIERAHLPNELADDATAFTPQPAARLEPAAPPENATEREVLLHALHTHRWNVTHAARSLQVCRATVYRRMARHGIVPPNQRG